MLCKTCKYACQITLILSVVVVENEKRTEYPRENEREALQVLRCADIPLLAFFRTSVISYLLPDKM